MSTCHVNALKSLANWSILCVGWLKANVTLLDCCMMFTQHVTGSFGMLSSRLHALLGQIIVMLLKVNDVTRNHVLRPIQRWRRGTRKTSHVHIMIQMSDKQTLFTNQQTQGINSLMWFLNVKILHDM